ncbi:MAG: universal stress protein [Caldilineaceae bacterium]
MFQRILVPVDFSEKNQRSLEIAHHLAATNQGTIYLLHIIEMIADSSFEEFRDFYQNLEHEASRKMAAWQTEFATSTIKIDHAIVFGDRVTEIVRIAEEQAADLIVMNSHRIDRNDPAASLSTISYKVSVLANCPVLLVK